MARPRHLRIVPRRSSVIVDAYEDPVSLEDIVGRPARGVPPEVHRGMCIASWARAANATPRVVESRGLELRCERDAPGLVAAFRRHARDVVGALGIGVPILLDRKRRAFAASWAYFMGKG